MTADPSQNGDRQPKVNAKKRSKRKQTSLDKIPNTPKKKLNKTEKKGLAVLDDKTRLAQILRYTVAGYSKEEISEELGITVKTVSNMMPKIHERVDREVAGLRENWINVTMKRTEILMGKLMLKITETDYDLEKSDVDMMQKLVAMQSKVMGNDAASTVVQNNLYVPQMDSNSPAYQYSLAQIQHNATGKTMDGLEDMVVLPDSSARKLDGLID